MMWCVGAGCACVRVLALLAAVMGDRFFAPRFFCGGSGGGFLCRQALLACRAGSRAGRALLKWLHQLVLSSFVGYLYHVALFTGPDLRVHRCLEGF